MKKLLAVILILSMLLPVAVSASTYASDAYILFIDAKAMNQTYNSSFDFDSAIFELVFNSDGKTAYFCKQMWKNGKHTSSNFVECKLTSKTNYFVLSMPDGSKFSGYFDKNQNGVWLTLGGASYFRFLPVQRYDISVDYKP